MRPLLLAMLLAMRCTQVCAAWPTDPLTNLPIGTNLYNHTHPAVASDGAGGAIVAWTTVRPGTASWDIYAQTVTAFGTPIWPTDGVPVTAAPGPQTLPQAVPDGLGGAIIIWSDTRSGFESDDIYAQRINSSGVASWSVNGVPVCIAADIQTDYDIAADGAGGAVVVWIDRRDGSDYHVYAQRMAPDGQRLWIENGVLICGVGNYLERPRLSAVTSGGVSLYWTDDRTDIDIYAQRLTLSGDVQWQANGMPICNATGAQYGHTVTPLGDGSGDVVVSWLDERNQVTNADIYAQRVRADGTIRWGANGIPVCTEQSRQSVTAGLALADESVVLCWPDERNGQLDLYANRLDATGNALWGETGLPVCVAPHDSWDPRIAGDGVGGVIVVWTDDGNVFWEPDLYAQRIDAEGNLLWSPRGVPVCTAAFDQHRPQVVPDSFGGVIVAWEDWRDGGFENQRYKIFAQRIGPDGGLGPPTSAGPADIPSLPQLDISPNPFGRRTELHLVLGVPSWVAIDVYSATGERVMDIALPERSAGAHRIGLDATGKDGRPLPSGVYFCRASTMGGTVVRKITIVR